jgi:hypothetical protein
MSRGTLWGVGLGQVIPSWLRSSGQGDRRGRPVAATVLTLKHRARNAGTAPAGSTEEHLVYPVTTGP